MIEISLADIVDEMSKLCLQWILCIFKFVPVSPITVCILADTQMDWWVYLASKISSQKMNSQNYKVSHAVMLVVTLITCIVLHVPGVAGEDDGK